MPKISVVIPHWPRRPEHDTMLKRCAYSLRDVDELIVIVNEGTGMGKAINKGLELATGDFLVVMNNDVVCHSSLKELCDPESITCPQITNTADQKPRSFYCMPRWVYEQVGGYDERFGVGYFEDDDLIRRWEEAGVRIRHLDNFFVDHEGGATLDKLPNRTQLFEANKRKYKEKWGES